MPQVKRLPILFAALCFVLGCAHRAPPELIAARVAYQQAASGIAPQESPEDMLMAKQALEIAESTFELDGDTHSTRDRAYVATRAAQLAEVRARIARNERRLASLEQSQLAQRDEIARLRAGQPSSPTPSAAEPPRVAAIRPAEQVAVELAGIASVRQEPRGIVITLSGESLFASGKAELLPGAEAKLSDVAEALTQSDPGAAIVVEGHTDAQGSEAFNLELSARRARVVRDHLARQGVAPERIRAEGLGFKRPISDNETAEGRANNRRVEIVVQPQAEPLSVPPG